MNKQKDAVQEVTEYYLERVDHDDGGIVYEIHGGEVIDDVCDTFIVFQGNAAKDDANKCLAALKSSPVDVEELKKETIREIHDALQYPQIAAAVERTIDFLTQNGYRITKG